MGKRGPIPQHERIRVLPGRDERRAPPPADLTEPQKRLWRKILASEPAALLEGTARQLLLRQFVEHSVFRGEIQDLLNKTPAEALCDPTKSGAFEHLLRARDRESKLLVALATRLRLTPQSRYTPSAAGTAARHHQSGPRPWDDDATAERFFTTPAPGAGGE